MSQKKQIIQLFLAGVKKANPHRAVVGYFTDKYDDLIEQIHQKQGRIFVIAIGKAAYKMLQGFQEIFTNQVYKALLITNYGNLGKDQLKNTQIYQASHPLPDKNGLKGSFALEKFISKLTKKDFVFILISGGASALMSYPVKGISLKDKINTTQVLLECGASIDQINTIRKHLSYLKGGGLQKLIYPATSYSLILSDVIGDDLSVIASGPTFPDRSTFKDACKIINKYHLKDKIPLQVFDYIMRGTKNLVPETAKPNDEIFQRAKYQIIGSNTTSLKAIEAKLQAKSIIYSQALMGEAKEEAQKLADFAQKTLVKLTKNEEIYILAGGETTVTLQGLGKGGRNQEFALAFTLAMQELAPSCQEWYFLSGGTDGRDGPTDSAGGLVHHKTYQKFIQNGINPQQYLKNNDSYNALKVVDALIMIGNTGTNVADLQILYLRK